MNQKDVRVVTLLVCSIAALWCLPHYPVSGSNIGFHQPLPMRMGGLQHEGAEDHYHMAHQTTAASMLSLLSNI